MAKFVFTGDPKAPGQDPQTCLSYGLTFKLNGDPVEAPNDKVAADLRRHSHFTESGAAPVKVAATPATPARPASPTFMPTPKPVEPVKPAAPDVDNMSTADLRILADQRGINHEDMSKSELQAALRA